jgi:hypothetical protein
MFSVFVLSIFTNGSQWNWYLLLLNYLQIHHYIVFTYMPEGLVDSLSSTRWCLMHAMYKINAWAGFFSEIVVCRKTYWSTPKHYSEVMKLIFAASQLFTNTPLYCIHLHARRPKLGKFSIYSNKFFHNFHLSESSFICPGQHYIALQLVVRKDMDVNEHVRLSNITLRHKLK